MYYENFQKLCEERKIKPADVSHGTGISTATLTSWKKGVYTPKAEKLSLIAAFFGVSMDYLMGKTDNPAPQKPEWQELDEYLDDIDKDQEPTSVTIPILGNVAAGYPFFAREDIIGDEQIDFELSKTGMFFALRIAGDSMEPAIKKGSTAIVRYQPDADNGDIVIAKINGEDATCKKLQKTKDGIMLVSINHAYPPLYFSAKEIEEKPVTIIGRVMEVRTRF